MSKNFVFYLLPAIILVLLTTACQTLPGFNIFSTTAEPEPDAPRSNFVAAHEVLLVAARQPVLLESYHLGATKIMTVEVSINQQPPRSEATAGQANVFPPDLATIQVLERGQPVQASLQSVQTPPILSSSPACQTLLRAGGPVQTHILTPDAPSSRWTVCHVWTGDVPGTYGLRVVAVDEAGRRGEPATQKIEVR